MSYRQRNRVIKSRFRSEEMRKFRAVDVGYYGDVLRKPGGPHEIFEAPADFACTWAEPVDIEIPVIDEPEDGTVLSQPKPRSEGPKTTLEQHKAAMAADKTAQESEDVEVL